MSYIGNRPENDAVINHIEYVATAGQTLFPVVYDSYVEVYLNGVRLAEDDFVKNNNVSISLVVGATAGDIVAVSGYQKVRSDSVASTDNAIARFDGVNGTLQNSDVFISDTNNLGVGVIPSSWDLNKHIVEFGSGGSAIRGSISSPGGDANALSINNNCYYNAGWKYIYGSSAPAARMDVNLGEHHFYVADAGTAGNTIAWKDVFGIFGTGAVLATGLGGLGYGTGAGGQVTQLTSKSTAVTLNKPSGQITMNNAALAAGASVEFIVNNSLVTSSADTFVITVHNYGVNYRVEARNGGLGAFFIRVTNITAVSLSEPLLINFSIIKGATA